MRAVEEEMFLRRLEVELMDSLMRELRRRKPPGYFVVLAAKPLKAKSNLPVCELVNFVEHQAGNRRRLDVDIAVRPANEQETQPDLFVLRQFVYPTFQVRAGRNQWVEPRFRNARRHAVGRQHI